MPKRKPRLVLDTNVLYAGLYSSEGAEKVSALMTEEYLTTRAKKAKKESFRKILDKVPSRKPVQGDEL